MKRVSIVPSVLTVLLVTYSALAHAQQVYVGGGYGHTFTAAPGYTRNIAFFIESESPEIPLGVRFEGNETISISFFTGNVTYAFGSRDARFRPYLVGGFGAGIGYFELGYTLNAGGGLRFRYPNSKLALFTEARVFRLVKVNESRHTIAPVTVGVRLGF
ncbi:MAG: hypothetical protein IID06_02880 [Gemmatimonadetes bacterium]|nr:hypothetical protein [Gemmatimonadota bacterium]